MQQHLTRKIINTDMEYLPVWTQEALDLVDDILHDSVGPDSHKPERSWCLPGRSDVTLNECINRAAALKEQIAVSAAQGGEHQ
jgi:hypothetical protein